MHCYIMCMFLKSLVSRKTLICRTGPIIVFSLFIFGLQQFSDYDQCLNCCFQSKWRISDVFACIKMIVYLCSQKLLNKEYCKCVSLHPTGQEHMAVFDRYILNIIIPVRFYPTFFLLLFCVLKTEFERIIITCKMRM